MRFKIPGWADAAMKHMVVGCSILLKMHKTRYKMIITLLILKFIELKPAPIYQKSSPKSCVKVMPLRSNPIKVTS